MSKSEYREYLQSPEWKVIREAVLERDNYTCEICKSAKATSVHHLQYHLAIMVGLNCSGLVSVCNSCHWKCHHDYDGRKIKSVNVVNIKTRKLLFGRVRKGWSNRARSQKIRDRRLSNFKTNKLVQQKLRKLDPEKYDKSMRKVIPILEKAHRGKNELPLPVDTGSCVDPDAMTY